MSLSPGLQFFYWQWFKNLKKVKESLPFCTLAVDVQARKSLLNDDVVLQSYKPQRLRFYEDTGTVLGFFVCCLQEKEKDVCVHCSSIISPCYGRLVLGYANLIHSHSSKVGTFVLSHETGSDGIRLQYDEFVTS